MPEEIRFERVYRGARLPGEQILDVGAGFSVDTRATHAIDKAHSPRASGFDIPGREVVSDVDYYPADVDIDTEGLPYATGQFDKVVSYGAFGWNFGTVRTAKELRRVLKHRGTIEIGVDEENLDWVKRSLRSAGFVGIEITSIDEHTYRVVARKK